MKEAATAHDSPNRGLETAPERTASPALGPSSADGRRSGPAEARWRWRAGVVGCGRSGSRHAASLARSQAGELAAVWDTDPTRRAAQATRSGLQEITFLDPLLEPGFLDLVVLAIPPHARRDLALRFLAAGVDLVCEQPIATSLAEARELVAAARASGRRLAMIRRTPCDEGLLRARERVVAGEIGELRTLDVCFAERRDPRGSWRADPSVPGSGVLMDQGADAFEVVELLGGPIAALDVYEGRRHWGSAVDEQIEIRFRGEDGWRGKLVLGWARSRTRSAYTLVTGSAGTIRLDRRLERSNGDGRSGQGPYVEGEIERVCAGLAAGVWPEDSERALRTLVLVEAARSSLARRVPVPVGRA